MTSVLVMDTCCLIDLKKGGLLPVLTKLPYCISVPLSIRDEEVLSFYDNDWSLLEAGGLKTRDLPPEAVVEATDFRYQHPQLAVNDCVCLSLARCFENPILVTGDKLLRKVATQIDLCVHGVLWIVDQLKENNACCNERLITALECWRNDAWVRLPADKINVRLNSLYKEG